MCKQDKLSNSLREEEREREAHTKRAFWYREQPSASYCIFKSQYHTVKSRITEFGSEKHCKCENLRRNSGERRKAVKTNTIWEEWKHAIHEAKDAYKEGKLLIWENGVKKYNPSSKKMGHFVKCNKIKNW